MKQRLEALRAEMRARGLAAYLVPRADEHLGEYVPPEAERLAWLTGFTGSAGLAVALADRAAIFVDGRYTVQVADETDGAVWERLHLIEQPAPKWLAGVLKDGDRVGCDPMLFSADQLRKYEEAGVRLDLIADNLVDVAWQDRPAPVIRPAVIQELEYAGLSASEKRQQVGAVLAAAGDDAAVLTDPASICWLLNIRGTDVDFTPFVLAFAVVRASGEVALIVDPAKISNQVAVWLGEGVSLVPRGGMEACLAELSGSKVRVDSATSPAWFANFLRENGAEVTSGSDPCSLPKACKNETEQDGARAAHLIDAVALCRFLHWFQTAAGETEISAAERLRAFRAEGEMFQGESFATISAAGSHGSIVHYRAQPESDRGIAPGDVYLLDSGGQYSCGTTDVTRTLWIGPDVPPAHIKADYTRVLQGHLALGSIKFPEGVCGSHLDALARAPLWRAGLDYDHGTGHGVGSYLSVHEGPAGISRAARPVPLQPGMILSNEPGFYPGDYGIRIENLVLVRKVEGTMRKFLEFETLTLVPYDRRLIDVAMLSNGEIALVDEYHARVLREVGGRIPGACKRFLEEACGPLQAANIT